LKIVIGLGNPGPKYVGTRHNVGFDVLAVLSDRFSASNWKKQFEAETTEVQIADERVLLIAPQTFMNLSGRSVKAVLGFYKLPVEELLLICDDINLPVGHLRLRRSGSAGGQKGLKNTIDQLGTSEFARLRVGVGRPPAGFDIANYVLQQFSKRESPEIGIAVERSADAVEHWVRSGIDSAMNCCNQNQPPN